MTKKRKITEKQNIIKIIFIFFCMGIIFTVGKEVFIRHFFNERLTVIPNVLKLSEKDAIKYLKKAGLKIKVNYSPTEKAPVDSVYIQFPEAGKKVKVKRTVQIWVNSGENVEIPNIIGMELLEARSLLQGKNIQIERIDYQPYDEKYNTIIGVYPRVGTKLEINQKITLLVSSQKISDPTNMPNLIGLDINDAELLLEQIGLSLGKATFSEDPTLPVNTIIATNPAPGSKVTKNQGINLVINKGAQIQQEGPSVEDIINQTNKEIQNKEIDTIIKEALDKIDGNIDSSGE